MSDEMIRDADSRSPDNAEEVERLRAEVVRLEEVVGDLMDKNRRLRLENAMLVGTLEGLEKGLREGGLITPDHMQEILSRFRHNT